MLRPFLAVRYDDPLSCITCPEKRAKPADFCDVRNGIDHGCIDNQATRKRSRSLGYVDTTCTPCRVCLDEAPNLLKYNDDETYVYFYKQPENEEEAAAAQRALDVCPTLAIGNDGE